MAAARVLDVGNCDFDHDAIRTMIRNGFDADVDRAHQAGEALEAVQRARYDLVLINRLIDADGSEGLDLVRSLRSDDGADAPAVMLISNFEAAQQAAVEAGAARGFGKAKLDDPQTLERLAEFLPRKSA